MAGWLTSSLRFFSSEERNGLDSKAGELLVAAGDGDLTHVKA